MEVTAYDIAMRFAGLKEVKGLVDNPMILAMLQLDNSWPEHDEVPWCSAFVNYICWLLRLPRSKSLAAKSWLDIGVPIYIADARLGSDIVVLEREGGGHVGFFSAAQTARVALLGGNQGDQVKVAWFPLSSIAGVRRLEI